MGPVEMSKQVGGTASSREPLILIGGSHITTHVQGRLRRRCNRGLSFNPDPNLCNVTRQFVCSFKNLPYLWNPPLSSLSLFLSLLLLGPGPLLLSCTSISALSSKGREGKARRGKEENIYIEKLARTMAQPTNTADLNQHPQQQQWAQPHQYQQQWMSMQYPATAMAMMQQQMMMYPQHYVPYVHHHYQPPHQQLKQQTPPPPPPQPQHNHLHQQQQQQQQNQGSPDEIRTIWLGDLHHWMDENYLHNCFAYTGEVLSAKVIRNKQTGQSEGYGFVEFYSRATAEKVLQNYNGTMMPNTDQAFRLNWATFSAGDRRSDVSSDLSIFVGDLAIDVTDAMLQETFASRYSSVKGAKVVIDSNTGRSKGYGFVRFGDENERSRAISEMNGIYCSSRPMRIGVATPKKTYGYQQQYSSQAVVLAGGGHSSNGAMAQGSQSEGDFNNTTIFVGGLDSDISDEDLRQSFLQFGEVVSVKIPVGKGCGFVQFADRKNAEEAIQALNGTVIGKQTVRLSWGRSPGNKHWRTDSNGSHYGGQGYGGHGFAVRQNQDMAMHPAATIQGAS